jgi:FlgD Ig-like domain
MHKLKIIFFYRGAVADELYMVSEFNELDVMCSDMGIFYSNDNGKTIELKYSHPAIQNSTYYRPHIKADATPGVLYMKSRTIGDTLYMSSDYGTNWEARSTGAMYADYLSGAVEGEIYNMKSSQLLISHDYGQSFQLIADYTHDYIPCDIGCEPGQLWGKKTNGNYSLTIKRMDNYSGYFDSISSVESAMVNYFSRGAKPGELYYLKVSLLYGATYQYKIYFSTDDGHNFELQYTSDPFCYELYDFATTGGRGDGSYYIYKVTPDYSIPAWVMEIDYSCDSGKTFKTYTHYLDETVMQQEIKVPKINASASPNPFSNNTKIDFTLEQRQDLAICIFDLNGSLVRELFSGSKEKGQHEIIWDGKNNNGKEQPSGIYFIQVQSKNQNKTLKVLKM